MVSSTPEVRQLNRERIRRELHVRKTCTKAEMAAWTGLSVSTCNTILNEMRADGEIIRTSQEDGYVGRPASRFAYNADYLHVLVVCVVTEHGENTVAFAVAGALGQVRLSEQRHPDAITYSVIEELIAEQLATDELIRGIALGIPGVARDGVVEDCDVDALVGVDVAGGVRDRFGINPEVRNDMDFIATGVYTSTPHNGGSLAAMLFPEDGYVGCGFVIDGAVLQGHSGFAGELYRIAEGFGIDRQAQLNALQDRHDFRELAAKAALIVCCTFDPEVIVLLGHGMDTDDLQAIRLLISNAVTESHVRHARRDRVDLRRSHLRLGDDRQPCRGQPASSGCGGARSVTFYRRAVRLEPRSPLARGARGRERDLCDRGRKPARGRPAGAVPGPQQRPGGAANRVVVRARLDRRRILHASGDGRCSFVDARDIAGVANAVLTEPGHHRREYALSGPDAITMSDVAKRSGAPWGGRSKQSRWKCLSTKGISRVLATIWRPSTPSPTSTVQ